MMINESAWSARFVCERTSELIEHSSSSPRRLSLGGISSRTRDCGKFSLASASRDVLGESGARLSAVRREADFRSGTAEKHLRRAAPHTKFKCGVDIRHNLFKCILYLHFISQIESMQTAIFVCHHSSAQTSQPGAHWRRPARMRSFAGAHLKNEIDLNNCHTEKTRLKFALYFCRQTNCSIVFGALCHR